MKPVKDFKNNYKPIGLHESFPPGMFARDGSADEAKAWDMVATLEKLVLEGAARNLILQKFSLLQLVPRTLNEYEIKEDSSIILDDLIG